jgi:cyclopropane fatty-acyl-phospholipid synthase-like methyltransferase
MSQSTSAWDEIFAREGRVFLEPYADMPGIVELLTERGARAVLDLGCGTGRHVVFLAHHGLSVSGLDNSPQGIEATRQWLAAEGLPHHIFTPDELREVFCEFDITDIHVDAWEHYCLSAFKR